MPNKTWDAVTEYDQIFVPTSTGYVAYNLLNLIGTDKFMLQSISGSGMAPLHFITQRGPFQDGSTPLDMRWDNRVFQLVISERLANRVNFYDRRWGLVDLLRPNRSFGSTVQPLIYRRYLPGGKVERGTDLVTTAGSATVTSLRGRFIHNGLRVGQGFEITTGADAGNYIVTARPNDYTLILSAAMAADATDVQWRYIRGGSARDLYCLLEQGPQFNESATTAYHYPAGYTEALRFIAHDPFWYGEEQTESWVTPDSVGDLIFDYPIVALAQAGAWFGESSGVGRWLFAEDFVGEIVNIIYWGHERAFPTIIINGPAEDPIITNNTTGVALTLSYDIALGESVTINVQTLSIQNGAGTNLFPYLTGDLATFSLEPEPQAPGRVNQISISYGGGTTDSSARLEWRNKYVTL